MREILFRAKSEDNYPYPSRWEYGIPFEDSYGSYVMKTSYGLVDAKKDTVGEFTGLTDKNGVRVFEGDIVQSTESGMKALVQYFPEHGAFMLWCRDESVNQVEYIGEVEMLMVKVIGNIHDNIELFPEYAGGDDNAAD